MKTLKLNAAQVDLLHALLMAGPEDEAHDELVGMLLADDGQPKSVGGLSRLVEDLVLNTQLSYQAIVDQAKEAFPDARTSTKSVASVACTMRKAGKAVPYRQARVG